MEKAPPHGNHLDLLRPPCSVCEKDGIDPHAVIPGTRSWKNRISKVLSFLGFVRCNWKGLPGEILSPVFLRMTTMSVNLIFHADYAYKPPELHAMPVPG